MVQPPLSQYIFSTLLQFLLPSLNILLGVFFLTSKFLTCWYKNYERIKELLHESIVKMRCFKTLRDCTFPQQCVEGYGLPIRYAVSLSQCSRRFEQSFAF